MDACAELTIFSQGGVLPCIHLISIICDVGLRFITIKLKPLLLRRVSRKDLLVDMLAACSFHIIGRNIL